MKAYIHKSGPVARRMSSKHSDEGPKANISSPGDTRPSGPSWRRINATIKALKIHNLHTKVRKRKFTIRKRA